MESVQFKKNSKFIFNIDRGGTFTDFFVQQIQKNQQQNTFNVINQFDFKVPSQSLKGEGPIIGIKNFLLQQKLIESDNQKIKLDHIERINLGTTIATNALLQRKGTQNVMILTKGFKDLLKIRHQARPNIFDLKCQKLSPLCKQSYEIDERVYVKEPPLSQNAQKMELKVEKIPLYIKRLNEKSIQELAKKIKQNNIKSVGISFCNSFLFKENQQFCQQILRKNGIQNIQKGSIYSQIGYLKRSETTNLNAFLNPIMNKYFKQFSSSFQQPQNLNLQIMKSDGGFATFQNVKASELLLSGPAGGLIGYSKIIKLFQEASNIQINNLIGLDMGGTSTDVSRIQNSQFSTKYSLQIQGIQICTPNLQIDTIAAGGGSKLSFQNGMFKVGPESVGSNPGPVCYGIGQQLSLTDANLVLNRLNSEYFPKVFGKNQNQTLNKSKSEQSFKILAQKINKKQKKSIQQISQGYIEIANELMAKSARKLLTLGKPDALIIFGSAGGQHCCDLAQKIGVNNVFIHRYSGILSAYGLSLASQTKEFKFYIGKTISKEQFNFGYWKNYLSEVKQKRKNLQQQIGFKYEQVKTWIGIGYVGTSHTILVPFQQNFLEVFQQKHKKQSGFSLPGKKFRLQFIREVYYKHPFASKKKEQKTQKEDINLFKIKQDQVFLQGEWKRIKFYDITNMKNCQISQPCILISKTSSILIKQHFTAFINSQLVYIKKIQNKKIITKKKTTQICDSIKLTLYSTRLMAIAQQMGKILQKISISTNIKERLDFSCGLFDWNGRVLANAPHIPVHLGSMQTAVQEQIKRGIKNKDVILSNHPKAGGSHLPDLTVITCVQINDLRFFVASRGHHADIGGIAPGSMPPFSKYLSQQGVAVQKFELMANGIFLQKQVRQLFKQSRRIQDNISDLLAQVAANQLGIKLIQKFIIEQGQEQFRQYIQFICSNAQESVRCLLEDFSLRNNLNQIQTIFNEQYMDDGTKIKLALTIDRKKRNALFDFTGTQSQVLSNTNAPESITKSAIIYCLRSLIGKQIPLNSGCLRPIQIIIPKNSILSPSKNSAVVGGNVETSQRLVDLILKPFQYVAASQGTMNNFLFGTQNLTYYETICGGTGAGDGFNGNTCQAHMTNTRITDVQSFQMLYPAILKQFSIRVGSGGKGKYLGGDGVIRQFLFLQPVQVSILSQRRVFSPYGLKGGQKGQRGKNYLIKKRVKQSYQIQDQQQIIKRLGGKTSLMIEKFDIIRIQTPGGGGYQRIQ